MKTMKKIFTVVRFLLLVAILLFDNILIEAILTLVLMSACYAEAVSDTIDDYNDREL